MLFLKENPAGFVWTFGPMPHPPPPQAFRQAKSLQCMGGAVAAPPQPSAGMDQLGQHATGHVKSVLARTALLMGELVVKEPRWATTLIFFAVEHQTMCQGYCFLVVAISSRHPSTLIELQNWWPCSTRHTYMYTLEFRLDTKNEGLQRVFKRDFLWQVSRSNLSGVSTSAKHPKTIFDVKATIHCEVSLPKVVTASSRCLRLLQAIFRMADWGWRPKELYEFWIGKLPLFIMKLQFPMCLVIGMTMWWHEMTIGWDVMTMGFIIATWWPRFSCACDSRRYLFCQERFALTNSGGVFGAVSRDMKRIHRAMIFRILEKDPGMLMYYAAHTVKR